MGTGIATGDTITTPTADNQTEQGGYSSFSRLLGTLTIATTSVAVGIGVNRGTGVLTTYGQRYPFAVQGLEVGGVGVSKVQAVGQVYHLRKMEDFVGTYVAVGADAAVGGGAGILTMRNQHGVVINLQFVQQGIKLTAGVEGITIAWKGRRGRS